MCTIFKKTQKYRSTGCASQDGDGLGVALAATILGALVQFDTEGIIEVGPLGPTCLNLQCGK